MHGPRAIRSSCRRAASASTANCCGGRRPRDIARINHYESGEYLAELRQVVTADGTEIAAWLYLGLDHLQAGDEPWSLEEWQAHDKPGFFQACDGWMADFGGDD